MKRIFLLLFEIGFGITFNIIGTISLSELFLLFFSFFIVKRSILNDFYIRRITILFLGLLCVQIISEIIVSKFFNNSIKGLAITIVSYLHFLFLFSYFVKDRSCILFVLIGVLARSFIFGTKFEGSLEGSLQGEDSTFLKFYLAQIIINILLIISVFISKKKLIVLIIVCVGAMLIILGARSSGLTLLLTGIISYFILIGKKVITKKYLFRLSIMMVLIGYSLYFLYVNAILSGDIISGNSEQLLLASNPYNPINLLIVGRTETFVGIQAFIDNFWFGHGAWAIDETGKYRLLMFKFRNIEFRDLDQFEIIPSHSVIVGYGVQNGVLAFLFVVLTLFFFIKKGIKAISRYDPYMVIIVSFIISTFWVSLFSPISHFRLTLPLYFATFLSSYLINKRKYGRTSV